jgi:hypothetical protein
MFLKFSLKLIPYIFALALFSSLFQFFPVNAATFVSPKKDKEDVTISEVQENLYVTGGDVKIIAPIRKDLVVAGNNIYISGPVERNIMAAGNELTFNSQIVGGTVRAAGNELSISGNYNEDVVIAGNKIVIKNAKIKGDLVVNANELVLENSVINGKFVGSYNKLQGNLNNQVEGQIQATQYDDNASYLSNIWFKFASEISILVGLAIITFYLYKSKKLEVLKPSFDSKFIRHFFTGLSIFLVPILALIVGVFLQIYPLVIMLWALIWISFALSNLFLPVYISAILKNSFKLKVRILYLIPIVYVCLLILSLLPIVGAAFGVLSFLLLFANFGYLVSNLATIINTAVEG